MASIPINIILGNNSKETLLPSLISCEITMIEGDYCFSVEMKLKGYTHWNLCNPNIDNDELRLRVAIGDETWAFYLEERNSQPSKDGMEYSIWGRSEQVLLSAPFAQPLTDKEDTAYRWQTGIANATDIINDISNGITVNWNIADFVVYEGTLSANTSLPIDIIDSLADASGAIFRPQINGVLDVDEYSLEETASVAAYTDLDDIVLINEEIGNTLGFNKVTVYGYDSNILDGTSVTPNISPVSAGLTLFMWAGNINVTHYVDVYYRHPDGDTPIAYFPIGEDPIEIDTYETTVSEVVTLEWGLGEDSNGDQVTGDTSLPFASTTVSVTKTYVKYKLECTVVAYSRAISAYFYFEDKSVGVPYYFPDYKYIDPQYIVPPGAVRIYNDTGTTIPQYGTLMITDVFANQAEASDGGYSDLFEDDVGMNGETRSNSSIAIVTRPNEDNIYEKKIVFTKDESISIGKYGWGYQAQSNNPLRCTYSGGLPSTDFDSDSNRLGTINGSFKLNTGGIGFAVMNSNNGKYYVTEHSMFHSANSYRVKALANIPANSVGEIASYTDGIPNLVVPTEDSMQPGRLMATGANAISSGNHGRAYNIFDSDVEVLCNGGSAGDQIGTTTGSTSLETGKKRILLVAGVGGGKYRVRPFRGTRGWMYWMDSDTYLGVQRGHIFDDDIVPDTNYGTVSFFGRLTTVVSSSHRWRHRGAGYLNVSGSDLLFIGIDGDTPADNATLFGYGVSEDSLYRIVDFKYDDSASGYNTDSICVGHGRWASSLENCFLWKVNSTGGSGNPPTYFISELAIYNYVEDGWTYVSYPAGYYLPTLTGTCCDSDGNFWCVLGDQNWGLINAGFVLFKYTIGEGWTNYGTVPTVLVQNYLPVIPICYVDDTIYALTVADFEESGYGQINDSPYLYRFVPGEGWALLETDVGIINKSYTYMYLTPVSDYEIIIFGMKTETDVTKNTISRFNTATKTISLNENDINYTNAQYMLGWTCGYEDTGG